MSIPSVERLKKRFYTDVEGWRDGTSQYLALVSRHVKPGDRVLDIGAGDGTGFAHPLKDRVKEIVGLDPDPGVLSNQAIDKGVVATAEDMPFPDARFDAAVSSFTLEHIERPEAMAREVFRVLRPGGIFIFRTPNLWHYVSLPAKLTPHWVHKLLANRLRGMSCEGAPSPFPTLHLCNTRRRIVKIFTKAGFKVEELQTIEPEPSYLQFSGIAFLLGVAYERLVNSTPYLSAIRVTIFAGLRKPIVHRKKT